MRVLHDAIRPPLGFELEHIVITTFTLDLVSLLSVPLAFTWFGAQGQSDAASREPLELLAAVALQTGRVTVFHQGGAISVPGRHQGLLSLVEDTLVAVPASRTGGIFHPKLWLAVYESSAGERRYRLLCLSRNLTPDRSWDTILSLEGTQTSSPREECIPLSALLRWLSEVPTTDAARAARVAALADEIKTVQFVPPTPFDAVAFHPLGIAGYHDDPVAGARRDRLLAVSPFVTHDRLDRLFAGTQDSVLVTRPEEFAKLAAPLSPDRVIRVLRLDDALEPEPDDADTGSTWLDGLHTKLYVADQGWDATVWTGSANATGAGFAGNVEFLVELSGRRSVCGVDVILGDGGPGTFASMLVPCDGPLKAPPDDVAERRLETISREVAEWPLEVHTFEVDGAWTLAVAPLGSFTIPGDVEVFLRPLSGSASPQRATLGAALTFGGLRTHEVSGLFIVELRLLEPADATRQFVASWPLVGDVPDRVRALILEFANNRDRVLAFIRLFLAFDEIAGPPGEIGAPGNGTAWGSGSADSPILELLLRALAREPQRLVDLAKWMPDLADVSSRDSASNELMQVWEPVWSAYREMHGG